MYAMMMMSDDEASFYKARELYTKHCSEEMFGKLLVFNVFPFSLKGTIYITILSPLLLLLFPFLVWSYKIEEEKSRDAVLTKQYTTT